MRSKPRIYPPKSTPGLIFIARLLAGTAILIADLILSIGWFGDIDEVRRLREDLAAMMPSSAVCLILVGAALMIAPGPATRGRRTTVVVVAGLAAVMAVTVQGVQIFTQGDNIDRRLFSVALETDAVSGATGFSTILGALYAVALICPDHVRRRLRPHLFGSVGLVLASVSFVQLSLDYAALRSVSLFSTMSLSSSLCFIMLFMAAMLLDPDPNWIDAFRGQGRGSRTARRLVPIVLGGPVVLGIIAQYATEMGLITPSFRLGLLVTTIAMLAGGAVVHSAILDNRSEAQLIREEVRIRSVIEGLPVAIFALDRNGRVLLSNNHALDLTSTHASAEEWFKEAELVNMEDMTPIDAAHRPLTRMLRGEVLSFEKVLYRSPNGEDRVLRFTTGYSPSQGENLLVLGIADITREEKNREKLDRAQKLDVLGQIAGGIAHDMGNILGVIRLSADAGRMLSDVERMREQFTAIQAACVRGTDLTSRILTFSKRQPSKDKVIDLKSFGREVTELARRTLPGNIHLDLVLPKGVAAVLCEPGQLESAILNLILNARDAIAESGVGGTITFEIVNQFDKVHLFVKDDGPGISERIRTRAFEPFFSTKRTQGGTGLGLASASAFVEQVGGTITLVAGPAGGTCAEVILPAADLDHFAVIDEQARFDDLKGVNLLVVEDDPAYGKAVAETLRALQADVTLMVSGEDAIDYLHEGNEHDLLLTDVMLSGQASGFEVANVARSIYPDIPIIYLTGFTDTMVQPERKAEGICLRKPIGVTNLVAQIRKAIDKEQEPPLEDRE